MGIIHIGKRAVLRLAYQFQTAGGADQLFECLQRGCCGNAGGHGKAGGNKRIGYLEITRQRDIDFIDHAIMMHFDHLLVAKMLDALQSEILTVPSNGADIETGFARRTDRLLRPWIVSEDHGGSALFHQRIEEPHLRGHIVLDGGMIIHVVAAEIGETGGCQPHSIETALVETMAGRLHRRMRHAFGRKFGQKRMQRHRIGRGERAVILAAGCNHTCRADLCGGMAGKSPDLPHEGSNGRFSRSTGDGDHGFRLFSVKTGSGKREIKAWIGDRKHRHIGIQRVSGNDGDRAPGNRVLHIGRAIRLGARNRHEQAARRSLAAVCGDPPDFDRPDLRQEQFFQFRKRISGYISQIHRLCPSCPPGANHRNIIS